jgi:hypothetical protein
VSDGSAAANPPSSAQNSEEPTPTPAARKPRSRRWIPFVVIGVLVLIYAGTVALYAESGDISSAIPTDATPPAGGVTVELTPQTVNAAGQRVLMDLSIETSPELTSTNSITPNETINVIVAPTGGEQSITFASGEVPATTPISVIADGEIENWPFDTYKTTDLVVIACKNQCADGTPIPTNVYLKGSVPGWHLTGSVKQNGRTIEFAASRSGSTIAFAVVLLALMIAMPCLTLFVAVSTVLGRRKVEPSFMSWMAAMLFATIPLRTFLPGSPPIGSWIDFLIVLWVIAGLVAGLIIYVVAWAQQRGE